MILKIKNKAIVFILGDAVYLFIYLLGDIFVLYFHLFTICVIQVNVWVAS